MGFLEAPLPICCLLSLSASINERAGYYWKSARDAAAHFAKQLYDAELHGAQGPHAQVSVAERLLNTFLTLPAMPSTPLQDFGLTPQELREAEVRLLLTGRSRRSLRSTA